MFHHRLLTAIALVLTIQPTLPASRWVFEESYFSRGVPPELAPHVPHLHGRTAYRRPYVNTAPGGAVRGGLRWNRYQIPSGRGLDTTIIRERWHQFQPAP